MSFFQKIKNKLEYEAKKALDKRNKKDQVLFGEPWNLEVNMIETANYLADHINKPILFAAPKRLMHFAQKVLNNKIKIIDGDNWLKFHRTFYESKYYFTAHWKKPSSYSTAQIIVNIWHGIPYKNISNLHGKGGVKSDFAIGTSPLTVDIFSRAFDLPHEKVINTGYPRNDVLIRSHRQKEKLKTKFKGDLNAYDKIIIWLPTLRKDFIAGHSTHGHPVDNAFQVENFQVEKFNTILREQNTLCIVKPHPFSAQKEASHEFSNILFINDQWLWNQGMTLYDLAGCTDALISDVSSIIIDYLLTDKPIICLSVDFDQYKKERGFVFDHMEEWMPTQILKTQNEFFAHLHPILKTGKDEFAEKRKKLRDQFFTYQDDQSAKRLTEYIFKTDSK